jgi:ADP-ribosyl-[dinitrogen reductase] hydrolase
MDQPTLPERCAGALLGLAWGDAVGTTVEFMPRGSFPPVTDMVGGGPFGLKAGQWTDDTSMALCLADSLLACGGHDAADQMRRYVDWWRNGTLSATGRCFDIGMTVASALRRFERDGQALAGSEDPKTAGNGGLMRLAPVVLYYHPDEQAVQHFAVEATRTTHAAPEALECTRVLAHVLGRALSGLPKDQVLDASALELSSRRVAAIAQGRYRSWRARDIAGTGYAVASLEAALWCFHHGASFEEAVLLAANLGDDADTTAAIVDQVAGAYHGVNGIPRAWRERVHLGATIERLAHQLGES